MKNQLCHEYEELVDLKVAGWLSTEEVGRLEAHLKSCTACRAHAEAAAGAGRLLAALPAPTAPRIDVALYRAPRARCRRWTWLFVPAAAACLVLAFWLPDTRAGRAPAPDAVTASPVRPTRILVQELSEAPPTVATYRQAASLSDDELTQVLAAHDRQIDLYEPVPALLSAPRSP